LGQNGRKAIEVLFNMAQEKGLIPELRKKIFLS